MEVNENENTTYQNLWDRAKAVLRAELIAMSAYIKRTEKISNKLPNTISQTPRKTRISKTQNKQRREIIKK
jgi:hypothetical protein